MKHVFTLKRLQVFYLLVASVFFWNIGYSQNKTFANSLTDSFALSSHLNTIDGDLTTNGTVLSNAGLALGIGAYNGFIEVTFPSTLPGNTTVYAKINPESNILSPLLGGNLGNLLTDVLGVVLIGNQELEIQARNGINTVLSANTANVSDFAADSVNVIIDSAGNTFLAITPTQAYDRLYISNQIGTLLGLGATRELEFFDAFYYNSPTACGQAEFTAFSGSGITLDLLNLGGAGVINPENAIDADTSNFSELNFGILDVAATLEQTVYFNGPSMATDEFRLKLALSSSLVNIGLADNIEIEGRLGNNTVFNVDLNSPLLQLNLLTLQNGAPTEFVISPNAQIDRITIRISSLLGVSLAQKLNFYGIQRIPMMPTIDPASTNALTCANDSIQLIANGNPSTLEMRWYDSAEGGNLIGTVNSGDPITIQNIDQDTTFYVAAGIPGCPEESERTSVDVSIITLPSSSDIDLNGISNPICAIDTVIITPSSTTINGNFTWYFDNAKTQPIPNGVVSGINYNTDTAGVLTIIGLDNTASPYSFYVSITDTTTGCENGAGDLKEAIVNIIDTQAPTTANASQEFCLVDYATINDIQVNEANILWYDAATEGNLLSTSDTLIDGTTYYASQLGANCESSLRLAVNIIINDTTAPTASDLTQEFCKVEYATVADLVVDQTNINWYDASTGGNLLNTTDTLTSGSYFAAQIGTACESSVRLMIDVIINDTTAPTASLTLQEFCSASGPTIADIIVDQANVNWYDAAVNGNLLNPTDLLVDGNSYFAAQIGSECESSERLEIVVGFGVIDAPTTNDTIQEYCISEYATIDDLQTNESNIIWYDAAMAGNQLSNTDTLTDNTFYYAATLGVGCESTDRLEVKVELNDTTAPTSSNSNQEFCLIEFATVDDIQVDQTNVVWYDASVNGNQLNTTDTLVDGTYYAAQIGSICESSMRLAVTISINDTTAPTTANTEQEFCLVDQSTINDIQIDQNNVNWYDAETGGNLLASNTVLQDSAVYYAAQQGTECESSARTAITVYINDTTAPTATDTVQTFCVTSNPTIADIVVNQNNIIWYDAATNGNMLNNTDPLMDGVTYYASLVGSQCESSQRLAVSVVVTTLLPPTSSSLTQEFCVLEYATVADIDVNETNVVWYDSPAGGNMYLSTDTLMNDSIYYGATTATNCESMLRTPILIQLNDTTAPTTANANQLFCTVDMPTVGDIQVDQNNVNWYDAETGGNLLASTTPLTNGNYYASQQGSICESSMRLMVSVTIEDTVAPTTLMATQSFCLEDMPTLNDVQVNQTNINWYDAASGGNLLLTNTPLMNGATYHAALVTSNGCESSQRLAVQVNVNDAPTPSTNNANQEFCASDMPSLLDIQINQTNVNWYDAATGGNLLLNSTALSDGTSYYASITVGNCESSTRLMINVSLTDTVAPTTNNANQEFCAEDAPTIADIQINESPVNWYNVANGGSALASTDALTTSTYYAALIVGNCESSTRLTVNVTVNDTTAPTTLMATQDFCQIDNPTLADIQVNQTNIIWYDAVTNGNILAPSTTLIDGATYHAAQIASNGCESSQRLAVTVNVANTPTPTTNNINQEFCAIDAPTISDIQVNENNVSWYDAATGGSLLTNTTVLMDGTSYFGTIISGNCESSTRLMINVSLTDTVAPTTNNANQEFCAEDAPTIADIQINESPVNWYNVANGGSALANTDALTTSTYYAALIVGNCESSTRLTVNVTVNDTTAPTTLMATQDFCQIDNPTLADVQVNQTNITWYDAATNGNILAPSTTLIDGATYHAAQIASNGCESSQRLAVTVNVNDEQAPTTNNTSQIFCSIDNPTIASIQVNQTNVVWMDAGANILVPSTPLSDGASYFGALQGAQCLGTNQLIVSVTITTVPEPTTNDAAPEFCANDNPTLADVTMDQPNINWYDAPVMGTLLPNGTLLVDGQIYYAANLVNGCESELRTAVQPQLNVTSNPTTSNNNQTFCAADNPTLADIQVSATQVVWYNQQSGGSNLVNTTTLVDGQTYYAANVENGCESDQRIAITVNLSGGAIAQITGASTDVCVLDTITYSTSANMTNYVWSVNDGTIVNGGTVTDNFVEVVWDQSSSTSLDVSYTNSDGCEEYTNTPFAISFGGCPDLNISKIVDNDSPEMYDNITFTITVENIGNITFNNIQVDEQLASGFQYVSHTTSLGNYDVNNGLWTINSISPNTSATLTITAQVVPGDNHTNIVSIINYLPNEDSDNTNNKDSVVVDPISLTVYNQFSPNGDGTNDRFIIDGIEKYPDNNVKIYNRYGTLVYETDDYQNDWDGTPNVGGIIGKGETVPRGTYYYIISAPGVEGWSGWLYLMQ